MRLLYIEYQSLVDYLLVIISEVIVNLMLYSKKLLYLNLLLAVLYIIYLDPFYNICKLYASMHKLHLMIIYFQIPLITVFSCIEK